MCIFASENNLNNKKLYDYNRRENPKENHRQHEHTTMEQDVATGGDLQVGSHHQAQYESGGDGAEHDLR